VVYQSFIAVTQFSVPSVFSVVHCFYINLQTDC
jgi:hypothetical protein